MSEYIVNTIQDMAAIPDAALPRFIEEFPALLAAAKVKREMIDVGIVQDEGDFIWRDDGEKSITARVKHGDQIDDFKVS